MTAPRNILVATDFSEESERALAYARGIAQPLDTKLHLLYVIPDPYSVHRSSVGGEDGQRKGVS